MEEMFEDAPPPVRPPTLPLNIDSSELLTLMSRASQVGDAAELSDAGEPDALVRFCIAMRGEP